MNEKSSRLLGVAIASVAVIAISGCGGSSSSSSSGGVAATPPPPVVTDDPSVIPASAGGSGKAFVSYVDSMSAEEVAAEPNTFASGFSEPAEDGDEPIPPS